MPDKVMPGPVTDLSGIREAVCIHTRKIYDSCRDKDSASLRYLGTRKTQWDFRTNSRSKSAGFVFFALR